MNPPDFRFRQVHLDFHTSPHIPDVGVDWDAADFVSTLRAAHVNSINLFAKCHHGMNYYPSKIGPVHPSLKFDLLGEQIAACHSTGIKCPIYISVGWEESAGARHPEWRQADSEGKLIGGGPLAGHPWNWPWMCLNNSYADELLAQTEELLGLYECDGFWFDIVMYYPDACLCSNCLASMKKAGRDAANAQHRHAHTTEVARDFMARASRLIRGKAPEAAIFYNSRWGLQFVGEREQYSQIEIESLPTGGWGYGFYPLWSRFGRTFEMPMLGMTGRFHRSWADWGGLKHPDALRFECGGILAAGGAVCIGDQLHPRGRLNPAVYEVIGEALSDVEALEEYCHSARSVAQIGLLTLQEPTDEAELASSAGALEGASKMLLELHHQFNVISTAHDDACWQRYEIIVVADNGKGRADAAEIAARLRDYAARGGKLLLAHETLLDEASGDFYLADIMGVEYCAAAECVPDYFEITDASLETRVARPRFAYTLYDGPTARVAAQGSTQVLAVARETYFNRTWEHFSSHSYTAPLAQRADYPAVTQNGNVLYIYGPIFSAYQKHGAITYRELLGQCLRRLIAPILETNAPSTAEVSLMRQGERHLAHIVNYHAARRSPHHVEALETPVPLRDVALKVRLDHAPQRVTMARSGEDLPFGYEEGIVSAVVPRVDLHEIVVMER